MSLPFNLNSVLATASLVEGFDVIRNAFPVEGRYTNRVITYPEAVFDALADVADDYQYWPEDQGFGSSDMTYVRKSFIDTMISIANLRGYYETKFQPYLKVVEYSEVEYHEMMLRSNYYETKYQPYLKVVEYSEVEYHEQQLRKEQGL